MVPGLLVKLKVLQLTIHSAAGFLDTHPLVLYIRYVQDRKLNYPQITQIRKIKRYLWY
jgi:hypothetical protein